MLNHLIRFSLAQRALILALSVVLLALGLQRGKELPVEVLPDLTKPTVTLLTECPGFAPEEVETLVTIPLENSLMGVTGVTRLRSINDISLSLIFVEFDWGTDIYQARQFVQERLGSVTEALPEGINPYMTPVASLMGNILLVGLVDPSGDMSTRDLREFADWTVARRLQSIPGIAEVLSMGGGLKQLHIQPNPESMQSLGVSFDEVRDAASHAVKNTTGGFLTEGTQEIMVRHLAMTTDLDEIGKTVVSHDNDRVIQLSDVATIQWDVAPMRGDAGLGSHQLLEDGDEIEGHRGIVMSITKSPGFDTVALTHEVEKAIKELQETTTDNIQFQTLYLQADYIGLSIGNLEEALRDGAIMVAIVLFLFLLNVRVTIITLTAIPMSLGMTVLVFDLFGLSVNSMTLGGLAIAIGMVVDDAIVDVENVFRRLRENANATSPKPRLEVIAKASAEVRSSIFYATILIVLVFLPLMALSGLGGRLFSPIAIATIVSMAASFVVSLTLIPVLSSYLLNPKPGKAHGDGFAARGLKWIFQRTWLRFALSQPLLLLALTLGLLGYSALEFSRMGNEFLPPFREPSFVIATTTAPGTSLKQTANISDVAMNRLLNIPGVETVGYRVGRAERGDHVVPVSTVEFEVEFDEHSGRTREEILADIRKTMGNIPGTFSAISSPLADRIGHMLSGVAAKIAVKVYGPDLGELRRLGGQIVEIARDIPGLDEARGEQQAPIPQLRIEIDRDRAKAYGVTPGELNAQLAVLMGGGKEGEIYQGQRVYDLIVRLPLPWREDPDRLASLPITTLDGQQIPLSYVADIREASGPNTILRENTRRRFVVSINPTSGDLVSLVEQLEAKVAEEVSLPTGYTLSFEGEYIEQQEAKQTIFVMSAIIFVIITFLLYSYFKSFRFVLLVLTNLPISLIGAILFTRHWLDNLSIATLVGFIAISGIAARNNVMMISHYLHLMRHEGERFGPAMVIRGTLERLIPVLMTAMATGIALIPLILAANEPGKEILHPVAVAIVGGLVSSTVLGLGLTPAIFYSFCKGAADKSVKLKSAASD